MRKRTTMLLIFYWVIINGVLANKTEYKSQDTYCDAEGNTYCTGNNRLCENKKEGGYDCGDCLPGFFYNEEDVCVFLYETTTPEMKTTDTTFMTTTGTAISSKEAVSISTPATTSNPPSSTSPVKTTKEPSKLDLCRKVCKKGRCVREGDSYKCKCNAGYEGKNCDIISWCVNNKDSVCGKVDCDFDDATMSGYCKCPTITPHFDAKNKICESIDKCWERIAKGECRKPHQYCDDGECKCENNYKDTNGECVSNVCDSISCGSHGNCKEIGDGAYQCTCEENYFLGEDGTCKRPNLCSPGISLCEQTCNEEDGTCGCYNGFTLKKDNKTCEKNTDQKECDDDCVVGKCLNDACLCPEVTHVSNGTYCIDRCSAGKLLPGTCPDNEKCKSNEKLGFVCECKGMYKQAGDGVHCERKSMCSEGGGKSECVKKNAVCVEKYEDQKGYECNCLTKEFTKDDKGVCIHKCSVPGKVRECLDILGVCELDTDYDAVCKCRPLMAKDENGKCTNLAEYSYTGDFLVPMKFYKKSTIPAGKIVKRSLTHRFDFIALKTDLKESLSGAFPEKLLEMNILNCREGGTYLNCSVELQMESNATNKLSLLSSPSVCNKIEGDSSNCLIPPRLVKKKAKTEFKETNPCDEDVKDKLCGYSTKCARSEGSNNFKCTCEDGFKSIGHYFPTGDKETSIENCEDIDECKNATLCPRTTDCVNIIGSYLCTCKDGFRKNDYGEDPKRKGCIAVCDLNPCGEHGTCHQTGQHGFACNCTGPYTGVKCDKPNPAVIDAKDKGRKTLTIVGGASGAALVVMLIIVGVMCKRMKGKSMSDTKEFSGHEKQSNMRHLDRNDHNRDIEIHTLNPLGVGDYHREYHKSDRSIPRLQVAGQRH